MDFHLTEYRLLAIPTKDRDLASSAKARTCFIMAMEMVENIIRSGSIRKRDRTVSRGPTDGISFSKPLRAMSLRSARSASLPHQLRTKFDNAKSTASAIQFQGISEIDGLPNLDELSPISYEELYASCDAMSSKSSVTASGKEREESARTTSEEKREKQYETAAESPTVSLEPGTTPGLQPSLPSADVPDSVC
ncbi:hypothetical protein IMZ48_33340 [Candidatus Bathyarchaeota archaeon]|nr:hypothetical protein [Candidatus Bathyarchaeota archaeon]